MNIGDKVRWTSQSQGSSKTKEGTVHVVVPAGRSAAALLPEGVGKTQVKFDSIYAAHDRYIVAVPRGGRSKLVDYYCPRPALLERT